MSAQQNLGNHLRNFGNRPYKARQDVDSSVIGGFQPKIQSQGALHQARNFLSARFDTEAQKALMWDRRKAGDTLHEIGKLFDRSHTSIHTILSATGGIRQQPKPAQPDAERRFARCLRNLLFGSVWHRLQACFRHCGAALAPCRRNYPCSAMMRFLRHPQIAQCKQQLRIYTKCR
ncbi:hypothetical protein [Acidovorax delafieldii]|nr:hypothetical protein [Acidovorax delafieldii]